MKQIDYRSMAEEWLKYVARQYEVSHVCRKDLGLIAFLLKEGFTLLAIRDKSKVLRVDILGKKSRSIAPLIAGGSAGGIMFSGGKKRTGVSSGPDGKF
jgi:hypothetical protein